MSSAVIRQNEKPRQLDQKAGPDEVVLEADVQDASKLARLLTRLVAAVAGLRRSFVPNRLDFEDIAVGAGTSHTFTHGFNGRVRWWVVDAKGDVPELLLDETNTTQTALVLTSDVACTITLRVEEAG